MMRSRPNRGVSAVEMAVALFVAGIIFTFLYGDELKYQWELRGAAQNLVTSLDNAKTLAAQTADGRVELMFRPTDGPYTQFTYKNNAVDMQVVTLPPDMAIVNANGIIRNHVVKVDVRGIWLDENNKPITTPSLGFLTLIHNKTSKIYTVAINPATGEKSIR